MSVVAPASEFFLVGEGGQDKILGGESKKNALKACKHLLGFSGVTLLEGARGQGMVRCPID